MGVVDICFSEKSICGGLSLYFSQLSLGYEIFYSTRRTSGHALTRRCWRGCLAIQLLQKLVTNIRTKLYVPFV